MRLAKQSARSDSKRDIDKKPARLVDVRRHTARFGNFGALGQRARRPERVRRLDAATCVGQLPPERANAVAKVLKNF